MPKRAKAPSSRLRPLPRWFEPKAIDLLKAASARLAAARSMRFNAVVSYENPSLLGPLVWRRRSPMCASGPTSCGDHVRRRTPSEFYYDGKIMVAFALAENLVAVADAPPTIDATLQAAFDSAAIYFPFSDVIVADPYGDIADGLKAAFYIGQSRVVGDTTTDIVAYVSDDVFVQIWIGAEDKLPHAARAVYYRHDPAQLRHQMELRLATRPRRPSGRLRVVERQQRKAHHVRSSGLGRAAGGRAPREGQVIQPRQVIQNAVMEVQRNMKTIVVGFAGLLIPALACGLAAAWSRTGMGAARRTAMGRARNIPTRTAAVRRTLWGAANIPTPTVAARRAPTGRAPPTLMCTAALRRRRPTTALTTAATTPRTIRPPP
jgi:hypothetical protein